MDSPKPHKSSEGNEEALVRRHFIQQIIDADQAAGLHEGRVHTRFPPEPNGYLHIGHAKAICVNFGLAAEYGGTVNLRFDDTNPVKEDTEYVDAIRRDIAWLGFEWNGGEHYTSDYFETLYGYAVKLIEDGKAYVDEQTAEDIAAQKGTPTKAGTSSPFRDRPIGENLRLFQEMRRESIQKEAWCCAPRLTWRMPTCTCVTLSCTESNLPITTARTMLGASIPCTTLPMASRTASRASHTACAPWSLRTIGLCTTGTSKNLGIFPSKQREFARLNLNYTIMSKRKLLRLVEDGVVDGWDDPRMPTISGLRRRGYSPESIREFCDRVGVAKRNNVIDVGLLEFALRNHLNAVATRAMAVLHPVKLVVTNYPEGQIEWLPTENNPEDAQAGTRELPFSRELFIEADDFKVEGVNKKWFRLAPGRSVRLKSAYIVTYVDHVEDAEGNVTEIHVEYHPNSKSGSDTSGIKAKGTLHWVECNHAVDAEVRLYDRLFLDESPRRPQGPGLHGICESCVA